MREGRGVTHRLPLFLYSIFRSSVRSIILDFKEKDLTLSLFKQEEMTKGKEYFPREDTRNARLSKSKMLNEPPRSKLRGIY